MDDRHEQPGADLFDRHSRIGALRSRALHAMGHRSMRLEDGYLGWRPGQQFERVARQRQLHILRQDWYPDLQRHGIQEVLRWNEVLWNWPEANNSTREQRLLP